MSEMLDVLKERSKKELEDIGTHEPTIYMDKNGTLVPYYLVLTSYQEMEVALGHFREMVMKEDIKRYWTVMESWITATRGLDPRQDINRKDLLMISEYNSETMENKKILLPFDRMFDDRELYILSEKIRKKDLLRGIVLPKLKLGDMKDPVMRNNLTNLHPDGFWSGTIVWDKEEAFTIGPNREGIKWMDRWNFFMEDISKEVGEADEWQRIEELVREIQEMDLDDFMRYAEQCRRQMIRAGRGMPPLPLESEMRQILMRMAESGALIKVNMKPADVHKMARMINEADPNISSDHIHAPGGE